MQFIYVVGITTVGKDPSFVLNAVRHSTTASRSTAYSSSLSPGDIGMFFPRLCTKNVVLSCYLICSYLPLHSNSTVSEQDLTSPHSSFEGCAMFIAFVFFWKTGSMFVDCVFHKHLKNSYLVFTSGQRSFYSYGSRRFSILISSYSPAVILFLFALRSSTSRHLSTPVT